MSRRHLVCSAFSGESSGIGGKVFYDRLLAFGFVAFGVRACPVLNNGDFVPGGECD